MALDLNVNHVHLTASTVSTDKYSEVVIVHTCIPVYSPWLPGYMMSRKPLLLYEQWLDYFQTHLELCLEKVQPLLI